MILVGLAIIFSVLGLRKAEVRSGGFILIGPFPILIGGKNLKPLLLLFLILIIVIFSLFMFLEVVGYA
jgi:uncharacterized membrane protein